MSRRTRLPIAAVVCVGSTRCLGRPKDKKLFIRPGADILSQHLNSGIYLEVQTMVCLLRSKQQQPGGGHYQSRQRELSCGGFRGISSCRFWWICLFVTSNGFFEANKLKPLKLQAGGCSSVTFSPDTGAVIRERKAFGFHQWAVGKKKQRFVSVGTRSARYLARWKAAQKAQLSLWNNQCHKYVQVELVEDSQKKNRYLCNNHEVQMCNNWQVPTSNPWRPSLLARALRVAWVCTLVLEPWLSSGETLNRYKKMIMFILLFVSFCLTLVFFWQFLVHIVLVDSYADSFKSAAAFGGSLLETSTT